MTRLSRLWRWFTGASIKTFREAWTNKPTGKLAVAMAYADNVCSEHHIERAAEKALGQLFPDEPVFPCWEVRAFGGDVLCFHRSGAWPLLKASLPEELIGSRECGEPFSENVVAFIREKFSEQHAA